ncbi:hypothetical protein QSQ_0862 [Clostridioides difficile P32]|nr:hypothetical protein QSQ_0862 [Clostridioides difficile P32]
MIYKKDKVMKVLESHIGKMKKGLQLTNYQKRQELQETI